jgi:hypothetical protein
MPFCTLPVTEGGHGVISSISEGITDPASETIDGSVIDVVSDST